MKDGLLSIVLIARENTSLHLQQALQSVLRQTYPQTEVLVVDANEPDSVYAAGLAEDLMQYPTVRLLQPEEHGADGGYRNFALHHLNGEYAAFLCGDDVWREDKAFLQIEQLRYDENSAASCANGRMIREGRYGALAEPIFTGISYDAAEWLLKQPVRMGSQVLYRTQALRQAHGFDSALDCLSDLDMLLRLSRRQNVLFFPDSLCKTRLHPDGALYRRQYRDGKHLLHIYRDVFLKRHNALYAYCLMMAHTAARGAMWMQMTAFFLLAFLRAPGVFLRRSVWGMLRLAGIYLRAGVLYLWARRSTGRLRRMLRRGQPVRQRKPVRSAGAERVPAADLAQWKGWPPFWLARRRRMRRVRLPDNLVVLRTGMFFGCEDLEAVEIPRTVMVISARAFQDCRGLTEVSFEDGSQLSRIGAYAFAGCTALQTLRLPGTVRRMDAGAFAGCTQLREIWFEQDAPRQPAFPNALRMLAPYLFAGCANLREVLFDEGSMLERVGAAVFSGCTALQAVRLMGQVDRIGPRAFAGCRALRNFGMPLIDAVTDIGADAFAGCTGLESIHIPDAVRRVRPRTYYGCTGLKNVRIPEGVQTVHRQAFGACAALKYVMVMSNATVLSPAAFPKDVQIRIYDASSDAHIQGGSP